MKNAKGPFTKKANHAPIGLQAFLRTLKPGPGFADSQYQQWAVPLE
jgi:hypothetical protein